MNADATKQGDLIAQSAIRVCERAGKAIRRDQTVEIRHERAVALRDDRFETIADRQVLFQQIMHRLRRQSRLFQRLFLGTGAHSGSGTRGNGNVRTRAGTGVSNGIGPCRPFIRPDVLRGIRGAMRGPQQHRPQYCDRIDMPAGRGTYAMFEVERCHPAPIDRPRIGILRHRNRPLIDVLFGFREPGTVHRCFVHTSHVSRRVWNWPFCRIPPQSAASGLLAQPKRDVFAALFAYVVCRRYSSTE